MANTIFRITTTAANESASFYLGRDRNGAAVSGTVNWGDGSEDAINVPTTSSSSAATHTYLEPGTYDAEVTITSGYSSGDARIYRSDSVAAVSNNIVSVITGNGIKSIGKYAFYNTPNLENVTLGGDIWSLSESAFYKSGVKSIDMRKSNVDQLPDNVFSNCTSLTDIKLNNIIQSIGNSAFLSCTNLTDLVIPGSNFYSIDERAFESTGITRMQIHAKTPPSKADTSFDNSKMLLHSSRLCLPTDAIQTYENSDWQLGCTITSLPEPEVPSNIVPSIFKFTTTEENETIYLGYFSVADDPDDPSSNLYDENSIFIDWGDGTFDVEFSNFGGYTRRYEHHYNYTLEDHKVKMYVTSGAYGYGDGDYAPVSSNITSVSLGDGITFISSNSFCGENMPKMCFTIGNDVTEIWHDAFYTAMIDVLVIPSNMTKYEDYAPSTIFSDIEAGTILFSSTADIPSTAFYDSKIDQIIFNINTCPNFGENWAIFDSQWISEHGPVKIIVPTNLVNEYTSAIGSSGVDPTTYTISTFDPSAITPDEFVFSTTDEDEEIFLEFMTNSYYSDTSIVDISWGDDTNSTVAVNLTDTPLRVTHNYSTIGNHTVHVSVLLGTAIMDHHGDDPAVSSNITSATTAANSNLILGMQALSYVTLESVTLNNENYDIRTESSDIRWNAPFCGTKIYNLDITNITNIFYGLFQGIRSNNDFNIPNNINSISDDAFADAMGYNGEFINISIPDSVTSFGKGVFTSSRIDTVTFGKGITKIPEGTFEWSSANNIIFTSEAAPIFENGWANFDSSYISTHGPVIITVPNKSIGAYTAAIAASGADPNSYVITSVRDKSDVVPTKFTFTTTSANENSVINLTSVGNKATVIVNWGDNAADETVNLTDAATTEISHEYTNEGTYDACVYPTDGSVKLSKIASNSNTCAVSENLTALVTGQYITTIDADAVNGTNPIQLSNVDLNGDLTTLGDRAFYGSTINKLSIGNNVTTMGECALAVNMDSLIIPDTITVLTDDVLNDSNIDSITLNSTIAEIDEGALVTSSCNDLYIKSQTPPTMAANSLKLSDGAVIHVPYGTTDAYTAVIAAADADPGNWTYTIEELPDPNRDPDEYDPDSIEDVPGSPAPEQNMSGDALKSILKAYGKNLKFIKTENNTISVNHIVRGLPYISSDDLIVRSFNGYDFVEVKSYDSYFRKEYISLIRVNDIRTFVIAKNARDQIDAFRC